ncbi:hypothetical protein NUSPORA_00849 [Nucleospora cyclopteri]
MFFFKNYILMKKLKYSFIEIMKNFFMIIFKSLFIITKFEIKVDLFVMKYLT